VPVPPRSVVYCDPPYANTEGYSAVGAFDGAAFWGWCRMQARRGRVVYVSEYVAPDFAECVAEFPSYTTFAKGVTEGSRTVERLFKVRG
jgi:site-specific DNA-adenine methylase